MKSQVVGDFNVYTAKPLVTTRLYGANYCNYLWKRSDEPNDTRENKLKVERTTTTTTTNKQNTHDLVG